MLGGQDFDDAIAELLLEQAKTTLDCEVDRTPVVMYKLHSAAEKIKRDLSAMGAQETDYSIAYLADGEDLDGDVTKEDVEAICKQKGDLFEVFYHFVFEMVSECARDVKIDSIQICGSGMRVPQLQARLLEAVQHARQNVERVGNTLNMEEACARGCALFAQKYAVEKVLACSAEKVELEVNGRVVSMDVFGMRGVGDGVVKGANGVGGDANGVGGDANDMVKDTNNTTENATNTTKPTDSTNAEMKDLDAISAGSMENDMDAISAGSNRNPKDLDAVSADSNEAPKDMDAISTESSDDSKDMPVDTGLFTINGRLPLKSGNDHDCTNAWETIL